VLFNTLAYAQFFAVAFALSWLLSRVPRLRVLFLLGASYFFYAHWDLRFLPLIWVSSTADWLLARAIAHARSEYRKKFWLAFTVVMNLGVLGFFKYWNFGVEAAADLCQALGWAVPRASLEVALPVGISFFTFESMSYVIDVYRSELEPHKSYLEYLTFVAFFPHLVAGPIVRPKDLLPQLAARPRFVPEAASEGLFLIALGLGKKIVIGDTLAVNLVDRVFDAPGMFSALETYAAVLGYALQIYCDFSGYTDIAIGSALLLGVRFPVNFDSPYKARSVTDFWRRWHISLSTWLRDYLYIPLGGNRKGRVRTYLNLLATMVLGGLWHGASWTFVAWGTLHGMALAGHKFLTERVRLPSHPVLHLLGVAFTFHFVCACWIFFRAPTFTAAAQVFRRLTSLTTHHPNLPATVLLPLGAGLLLHFTPDRLVTALRARFIHLPGVAQGLLLYLCLLLFRHMAQVEEVPFVYFQF